MGLHLKNILYPKNPRYIWIRYAIAIGLLLFAMIVTWAAPTLSLSQLDENATAINVSGRQRMLSQRILFQASEIKDLTPAAVSTEAARNLRQRYEDTISLFADSHDALINGSGEGLSRAMPESVRPYYFESETGPTLDENVKRFVNLAREISNVDNIQGRQLIFNQMIDIGRDEQLAQLDAAVSAFEASSRANVERLEKIGNISFIAALILLALEAFLIFTPAQLSLNRYINRLESRTRELEFANVGLQNFAYVASHDLRSPLRGMANLVNWIKTDITDVIDDDTADNFKLLETRIVRMERLLDDILAYSRADRVISDPVMVNLPRLIADIESDLMSEDRLIISTDLYANDILTWETLLEQIFSNLFVNSLKHVKAPKVNVHVSYFERDNKHHFLITDDGPGIPTDYHDYVFGMFNQIKRRDETEGSGIGLAIVKRIIEAVGGQITILDNHDPGQTGARFHLMLPKPKHALTVHNMGQTVRADVSAHVE